MLDPIYGVAYLLLTVALFIVQLRLFNRWVESPSGPKLEDPRTIHGFPRGHLTIAVVSTLIMVVAFGLPALIILAFELFL